MGRQIITKEMAALPEVTGRSADKWVTKVLKLMPAEVVSVYIFVFNFIKITNPGPQDSILQWSVFVLILGITPFYLYKIAKITSRVQIVMIVIAFMIWVLSIGGPLDGVRLGGYSPQFLGDVLLPIYTLVIPIFYEK